MRYNLPNSANALTLLNDNSLPIATVGQVLRRKELSGIQEILKTVALKLQGSGCVLWEFVNETTPDTPTTPAIYPLSEWFERSGTVACPSVSIDSELGEVILSGKVVIVEDTFVPVTRRDCHPLALVLGLHSSLSVPLHLSDTAAGAISVYRKPPNGFNEADKSSLVAVAELVPLILETLRDQLGYRLLAAINDTIGQAEGFLSVHVPQGSPASFDEHFEDALRASVLCVAKLLESLEVSLFLKMPHHGHELYEVIASTVDAQLVTRKYSGTSVEGLTGWVLEHQKALRVLDLKALSPKLPDMRSPYTGISWRDSAQIETLMRNYLELGEKQPSPPLSFMATPITVGDATIGVIRCAALTRGLNHYGARELSLLGQVAALLGRFWDYYTHRRDSIREVMSLQSLARGLKEMNSEARKELSKAMPSQTALLSGGLSLLASAIPEATGFDVRVLDALTSEMKYVAQYGPLWNVHATKRNPMKTATEGVELDSGPLAADWALSNGEPWVSLSPEEAVKSGETFPGVKGLIVAPIGSPSEKIGVVDVHVTERPQSSERLEIITQLVAQQLGLYYNLASSTAKRRRLEDERTEDARQLIQMVQDISHQLRSPINQAHLRIQSALRSDRLDELHKLELLKIRGLCSKAKRVTTSFRLFAALAKNEPISLRIRPIRYDELIKSVIEAASDHELLLGSAKSVRFEVERKGFEIVERRILKADISLLMQALDCLVDNAAKYCFPRTTCRIAAGITGRERFFVSIQNRGLMLRSRDAKKCCERGFRSDEAWSVTGEGSGIGLWLVDNIMKSHGGELLAIPTNSDGWTEFRILFPLG